MNLPPLAIASPTAPPTPAAAEAAARSAAAARVQPDSFLTLHYRMIGPEGQDVVSSFGGAPATLSLGSGQLAPAIEQRLVGLAEGERTRFELPPGAAYGERNPALLQRIKRTLLRELGDPDAEYRVGDVVQFPAPAGQPGGAPVTGVLREIGPAEEGWMLFDFNHPLAGQPLGFEVHVLGVL